MASDSAAVRSLLKDVVLGEVVTIDKRKLLWFLGWGQERPAAWVDLLALWTEVSQGKGSLYGADVGGTMVLHSRGDCTTFQGVSDWTFGKG